MPGGEGAEACFYVTQPPCKDAVSQRTKQEGLHDKLHHTASKWTKMRHKCYQAFTQVQFMVVPMGLPMTVDHLEIFNK